LAVRIPKETALQTLQQRALTQADELAAYSAKTLITADLPDSSQHAQLELTRSFTAPAGLAFTAGEFSGDRSVKTNVIARFLQAEVTHVQHDSPASTALNQSNYKFEYQGLAELAGLPVHVFQVKPRHKVAGLFSGKIYLDAVSGELKRSEGTLVKSPSLFIKKISFVEDFASVDGFTLPVRLHSEASTRLVGKVMVEVATRDYKAVSREQLAQASGQVAGQ
jgi:hypothetical protein